MLSYRNTSINSGNVPRYASYIYIFLPIKNLSVKGKNGLETDLTISKYHLIHVIIIYTEEYHVLGETQRVRKNEEQSESQHHLLQHDGLQNCLILSYQVATWYPWYNSFQCKTRDAGMILWVLSRGDTIRKQCSIPTLSNKLKLPMIICGE